MFEATNTKFADMIGWLVYTVFQTLYNLFEGYTLLCVAVMLALVISLLFALIIKAMKETFT
jgi:hypothetical protein